MQQIRVLLDDVQIWLSESATGNQYVLNHTYNEIKICFLFAT